MTNRSGAEAEPGASEVASGERHFRVRSGRQAFGTEEHLLSQLLLRPDLLERVDGELIALTNSPLAADDLDGGENRAILAAIRAVAQPERDKGLDEALDGLPEELHDRCLIWAERARQGPELADEQLLKDLAGAALRLRARNLGQATRRLQYLILECETAGETELLGDYKALMVTYAGQERRLQKLLYARTLAGSLSKDNGNL